LWYLYLLNALQKVIVLKLSNPMDLDEMYVGNDAPE